MRGKKIIIIIICIFLVAITFIGIGLYINSLSKPKNVLKSSMNYIKNLGDKYILSNDYYNIGDTYTVTSAIDFNLDSDYYKREDIKKYNYIKNISNMDTKLFYKQNKDKKSSYMDLSLKLEDEELLGYKRIVNNSTEYYFINGILDNYVNNGNCNYFESISTENTTKDNIDYLYNFIFNSLNKNMKDEYFETFEVKENISGKNISVNQLSIRFTNKMAREILNNVLKDLKKDERSFNILNSTYKGFDKYKVKDKVNFFDKDENYTLNIYTTKFLYKPLKYEIVYMNGDIKKSYIFEKNKKIEFYYLEDDKITYTSTINVLDNSIIGKIYNASSNEVGEFNLEKKSNNLLFNYTFNDENERINMSYSSKYSKVKKNKSFINTKKLKIKYLVNNETKLNGDISVISNVENKAVIEEEAKNPIIYAKLAEDKKDLIDNKYNKIKERLEK